MSLLGGGSNTINIGINATDNASAVIGNVGRNLDGLNARGTGGGGGLLGGLGNTAALAGIAAGVGMVGAAAFDLGNDAARVEALRASFESLTAGVGTNSDELLASLKDTSAGTISEENLMLAANKAMLLGVADTADEFTAILAVAKSRGQAMGLDVTQSFDNLVTGVGRGSALILDNLGFSTLQIAAANEEYAASLGISADEMDDSMKKAAMLNLIMQEAADIGAIPETTLDGYQRLGAEWDDLKANLGDTVQPVTGGGAELAANVLGSVNEGIDFLGRSTLDIEQELAAIDTAMQGAQLRFEQNRSLVQSGAASPQVMDAYIESLKELNQLERDRSDLEREMAGVTRSSSGVWAEVGAAASAAAAQEALAARNAQELATAQATPPPDTAAQESAFEARAVAAEAAAARIVAAEQLAAEAHSRAALAIPTPEAVPGAGGGLAGSLRASGAEGGKAIAEAIATEIEASAGTVAASGTTSASAFGAAFTAGIAAQRAGIVGSGAQAGAAWLTGFLAQVQAGIGGQLISILAAALAGPVAQAQSAQASRRGAE